jgi:CBS domain containing-hemolysin-like protein
MILYQILLIFLLIAVNAFFVGVEFSAVASRRARLDLIAEPESRSVKLVRQWLDLPAVRDRLIAASQLGITLVSLAIGAVGEKTVEALLAPYFETVQIPEQIKFIQVVFPVMPLFISLLLVTGLHVVLGEQVPKVAVLRGPERFALWAAPIMQVFGNIFKWFIDILDWATRSMLKLIGLPEVVGHSSMFSIEELREMVSGPEVESIMEKPEREMLSAVIDFGELVVRQVSLPRTEIIGVEADSSVGESIAVALENDVTKLPVFVENLDQVVGIVHLKDLVKALQKGSVDLAVKEIARQPLFVPETISVNNLLYQFKHHKTHIAIVLDEFGGTNGLVTLEDLMEEIVGEVHDKFETDPPAIQPQADGSYLLDGMILIEEINEHFELELLEENYDTIAGYMLGRLGRIPQVGDQFEDKDNKVLLKIEKMERLRIACVRLSYL